MVKYDKEITRYKIILIDRIEDFNDLMVGKLNFKRFKWYKTTQCSQSESGYRKLSWEHDTKNRYEGVDNKDIKWVLSAAYENGVPVYRKHMEVLLCIPYTVKSWCMYIYETNEFLEIESFNDIKQYVEENLHIAYSHWISVDSFDDNYNGRIYVKGERKENDKTEIGITFPIFDRIPNITKDTE